MVTKRYTQRQLEGLMARLIVPARSASRARRMLADLLRVETGETVRIAVGRQALAALNRARDTEVMKWQAEVELMLRFDLGYLSPRSRRPKEPWAGQAGITQIHTLLLGLSPDGAIRIEVWGDLWALLGLQLALVARTVGFDGFRQCECGKLFVRSGKRLFCSERCQKRVYMRRFRAGEIGKE